MIIIPCLIKLKVVRFYAGGALESLGTLMRSSVVAGYKMEG